MGMLQKFDIEVDISPEKAGVDFTHSLYDEGQKHPVFSKWLLPFATWLFHMLAEVKQLQLPQPLLTGLVVQTLHQLHCPSPDTPLHLDVFLVVRGPELNTEFKDAIGFLGQLGTLMAHVQLAADQNPQALFCRASVQPLLPKPVALAWGCCDPSAGPPTPGVIELITIGFRPSIQHVQVLLQSLPALQKINTPTQLGVICKLTEGSLKLLVQISDKDTMQD
ncbi:hypothetical protein BTVI_18657 [Pitangus sulphuratus]|nr:hypothetical protein BTVI_18657 [Pitangus sulphuratus]